MSSYLLVRILFPVIKIAVHVILIHVNNLALHTFIHGILVILINISPPLKIRKEFGPQSILDHISKFLIISLC